MTNLDSFERALFALANVEKIDCPACEDGTITITYKDGESETGPCPICDGTQMAPDMVKLKSAFMEALDK